MNARSTSLGLLLALLVLPTFASAQQPQSMPSLQTFDQGIPADWEFSCNRSLIAAGTGSAMRIWGGGHAILPVTPQDFMLGFRFRSAGGAGDIGFNFTDHSNSIDTITLAPDQIVLSRRTQIQPGQFQHQDFASGYANFQDGLWHDLVVQYKNGRVDVWVDRVPVIGYQHTSRLPQGVVGLGVILNSGSVDFDNVSYGPARGAVTPPVAAAVPGTTLTPPGTTTQPGQLMVTQPPPSGSQPVTGAAQTDLAVTDVYATRLRNGQLFAAITNRGPLPVTQQPVELQLNIDGAMSYFKANITLAAGQTTTLNTGSINTASASSSVQVRLTTVGLNDPNTGNNLYSEVLPQASSIGNQATDLVLSDIRTTKKIQGQVVLAVTNRGPTDATGQVEFLINVNGQQHPTEQYVVPLKPNETREIHTNAVIDASQGDQTIT
ncbi:MAG: hypothetical protein ACR2NP_11415, partial [Pirellulaceae bacterium]